MNLAAAYSYATNLAIKYLPEIAIVSGDGKITLYLKENLTEGCIDLVEDPADECNVMSLTIKEFLSTEWKLMVDGKELKTTE